MFKHFKMLIGEKKIKAFIFCNNSSQKFKISNLIPIFEILVHFQSIC